jgi:protein O-GlcNAc transferase
LHLTAASELTDNNAEVLKMLGGMLLKYGTDDDVPKARESLKKANELKPNDPEILMNFGYTLYLANMFNEAITLLKRAIELQPIYPEAHYNIALAYSRTGDYKLARQHWEKVIEQSPKSPIADKATEFVNKIKKSESDSKP